jgi:hypothetical protein
MLQDRDNFREVVASADPGGDNIREVVTIMDGRGAWARLAR